MNKYILIIISILLLLVIGIIFLMHKPKNNPKQIEFTYEINAGIPFKWEYEIEDESIVKFVKSYVIRDDNKGGIVGASVYTNYVFEGIKKGTTTITFRTVSITGEYPPSNEQKHVVTVDNSGNISLQD